MAANGELVILNYLSDGRNMVFLEEGVLKRLVELQVKDKTNEGVKARGVSKNAS